MTSVPQTWQTVSIVEILKPNGNGKPFQQGWSPQCESHPANEDSWGVLRTTAIQPGMFWDYENKSLPVALEPRPNIEVKPGDLLMTCAGPRSRCGIVCLVERTRPKLMMSGKMYRFRPNADVMNPRFLTYFIQCRKAQLAIDGMKTGISDSGLNLTHDRFGGLNIPVAPRAEQDRVVAKIDELFSEIDKGVESLTAARDQIKVYQHAVLKHAFEGKLTERWRSNNLNVAATSYRKMTSQEQVEENLAQAPKGWEYVRLGELTDIERPITYGVIKLGSDVDDGVPTLRSSDVRKLKIELGTVKRISPDIAGQYRRTFLRGGEVLVTVRGTLGGVAVVPKALEGWNISREVAMIVPAEGLDANYLQYMLASPQLETWFKARLRGVAYTGINLGTLRLTPVFLCSPAEQEEIVISIQKQMSIIAAAESEIDQQLNKVTALRQSILKNAFSGQLIAQDPNDEPASVLLERIRAEREQLTTKQPRNNKNNKKEAA